MLPQYLRDTEPLTPLAPGETAVPRAAGPAVGVILDSLTLLCALLVLLRSSLDSRWRLQRTWSVVPLALLAIYAFASTLWAADKFASAVAGSTWLAGASLVFVFAQTVRTWARLRVVAAVLAGLFLVNVAHGIIYRVVDLPTLQEEFQRTRLEVFAARGWDPESFVARNFESRLMQGQTGGFAASPNSYGAALVLLGFVMAGVAWQRWRDGVERGWAIVLALLLIPGAWILWTTQSRTAMAAAFLAAIALLALFRFRDRLVARRGAVFLAIVAGVMLGAALVVGIGLRTGTLPHDSLAFRWNYWVGAAKVFNDAPLAGVGFGNFGDFYLAHRLPVAAEEVKDPHNLFVRFFTELGIFGGLLSLAWLSLVAWEQTRPANRPDDEQQPWPSDPITLRALGTVVILALLVHTAAAVDFTADPYYVFLELVRRGLYGLLIIGAIVLGCIRSAKEPTVATWPAPAMLAALLAGLAAALLHSMVDVVVFETSVLVSFAALMGASIGIRAPAAASASPLVVRSITAFATVATIAFVALYAFPLVMAEQSAARADALVQANRPVPAMTAYRVATDWSPVPNSSYYERLARAQALSGRPPEEAEQALKHAIRANPRVIHERVLLAGLYGSGAFQPPRLEEAEDLYEHAVDLNPNDMSLRTSWSQLLEATGQKTHALEQLQSVLKQNAQLNPDEPERLTPSQVEQVTRRIEALRVATADQAS